jgi:sugar lactone lactonase YvrE
MADRIRKINTQTGDVHAVVTTSDLLPATASIYGLAVSANGTLYAADYANDVVYKIFEDGRLKGALVGKYNTPGDVASSGLETYDGNTARLRAPIGICVDSSDNIYVADAANHKVKRLSPSGRCQTLAGGGSLAPGDVCSDDGLTARFAAPTGIAVDKAGIVYVCDTGNSKIKKIWPSGKVTSLSGVTGAGGFQNGNGGDPVLGAKFLAPQGICVDSNGTLYVADTGNDRVRKIDEMGNVVTLAGFASGSVDGVGNAASFGSIYDICIDASGTIFVLDYGNSTIRRVTTAGKVTTLMGWKTGTIGSASCIAVDKSGFLYFIEKNV